MHTDVSELPQLKIEIDSKKIIAIMATVFTFLVLPIYTIDYMQQSSTKEELSSPSVAGAFSEETSSSIIQIPFLNQELNLNSESGALILLGITLITISLILTIYLFFKSPKKLIT